MSRRFPQTGLPARCLASGLALAVAGVLCVTTVHAAPAPVPPGERPATRPGSPAKAPGPPTATPPARKATPRTAPPRRKARPVVPPKKKRARTAPPRRDLRPRLPERRRPDVVPPKKDDGEDAEPVEKTMRTLQGAAWAMVGVTAVLLTVTGVFALMVEDREDEMERLASFVDPYSNPPLQPLTYDGRTKRDFETYKDEGRRFSIVAFTFLGLSAAAAVAATTLFVLDHVTNKKKKKKESSLRWQPMFGPKGAGVSLGLEF